MLSQFDPRSTMDRCWISVPDDLVFATRQNDLQAQPSSICQSRWSFLLSNTTDYSYSLYSIHDLVVCDMRHNLHRFHLGYIAFLLSSTCPSILDRLIAREDFYTRPNPCKNNTDPTSILIPFHRRCPQASSLDIQSFPQSTVSIMVYCLDPGQIEIALRLAIQNVSIFHYR